MQDGDTSGAEGVERRGGRRTADGEASDYDDEYDSEYDSEGDDLERDEDAGGLVDGFGGSSGEKGKSITKGAEAGDLRKTRVRQEDYAKKRSQSAKLNKKGKYGVTVPRPFTMCKNEGAKPKSIRQKKIDEMIAQKKLEEEAIVQH